MKQISIVLIFLFLMSGAFAQTDFRKATEQEKLSFTEKLSKSTSAFNTLTSNFIQNKTISILDETVQSEGRVYFKKQDQLCWQYLKPYSYKFVINGDKILVENGKDRNIMDANSNKLFGEIKKMILSTMNGKSDQLKDFEQSYLINNQFILISLLAKSKEMKSMMREVKLYFEKSSCIIDKIEIVEESGDATTIQLKDKQINTTIKDEIFNF